SCKNSKSCRSRCSNQCCNVYRRVIVTISSKDLRNLLRLWLMGCKKRRENPCMGRGRPSSTIRSNQAAVGESPTEEESVWQKVSIAQGRHGPLAPGYLSPLAQTLPIQPTKRCQSSRAGTPRPVQQRRHRRRQQHRHDLCSNGHYCSLRPLSYSGLRLWLAGGITRTSSRTNGPMMPSLRDASSRSAPKWLGMSYKSM